MSKASEHGFFFSPSSPQHFFFNSKKKARFLKNVFPGLKPCMSSFSPEQMFMAK